MTLGPTIYWFPTHWDFWGLRTDHLSWLSAKIQLTITGVTGHYADVLLGLLIIPVSRDSLVGQAFSVHHGTLILAHRLISYLFSIAVAAHGITYIVSLQHKSHLLQSLIQSRFMLQMAAAKVTKPKKRLWQQEIQQ